MAEEEDDDEEEESTITTTNVSQQTSDHSILNSMLLQLNVKTLESHTHKFQVHPNMPISLFKDKIATQLGVPVARQRLIFRGNLLKDDHLLSQYHFENGHTLHLVTSQLSQSSSHTGYGHGQASSQSSTGNFPSRVRQISQSVVLGTFNVGDQGGGVVPDVSRVVGAVLNSFGIGGQIPGSNSSDGPSSTPLNIPDQTGNQSQSPENIQIPLAAEGVATPSIQPIPDSLNTVTEFMNRMEQAILQNGNPPNSSSTSTEGMPRVELPTTSEGGVQTPETLSIILQRAQQLLSNHITTAISHMAGRLEQEGQSPDRTVREQIQVESTHLGLVMQHLGTLFLELGSAVLTLRLGQSPAESSVNAGPALYISPSGPNPLMVHPFPGQTSQLFGGSSPSTPISIGTAPRNVNIHIHAGQCGAISSATQPGVGTQASTDPVMLLADVNSALRNSRHESNSLTSSGQVGTSASKDVGIKDSSVPAHGSRNISAAATRSSSESGEGSESERVPLGLGMGTLEPKLGSSASGQSSNQHPLNNAASAMSRLLESPAMDGLLAGFSQQAGVGSPDALRIMLQQFTQNPEIMNTVTQLAQQVDTRDLSSGSGVGGLDLSQMVQQMMPVVSRALSHGTTGSHSLPSSETGLLHKEDDKSSGDDNHIAVRDVAHRIENYASPENIFRSVVENATRLYGNAEDLTHELCTNQSLASEYVELLQRDLSRRLQDEFDPDKS